MPSTYTTNLGIEKIATGEQSGTWGTTTNTNFDLIDTAVNGIVSITLASAGTSGSPNDLPINDGTASDGRNKFIEFVDGGDLGATAYVQLTPNDAEKIVHIRNSLSGSRSIIVFQGTYNASNDFEIPNGADVTLKFDGAGTGATVTDVNVDLTVTGATIATADINGGTIDGTVIGGASAAAGTFTTFTSTGIDDNATSTAITIDSSENVGIGTNTTAERLRIQSGDVYQISFRNNSASGLGAFGLDSSNNLVIYGNTAERMRIDSSGNVGIGTTSPSGGLHVKSSTDIVTFESTTNGLYNTFISTAGTFGYLGSGSQTVSGAATTDFGIQATTGNFVVATGGNTERMRIDSSGNVGIGTSSPTNSTNYTTVNVSGDSTGGGQILFQENTSVDGFIFSTPSNFTIGAGVGNPLIFQSNSAGSSERMRIDSSGNVGIGTSSPAQKLHINGASGSVFTQISSGSNDMYLGYDSVSGFQTVQSDTGLFFATGASFTERMRIDSDGTVRINGAPSFANNLFSFKNSTNNNIIFSSNPAFGGNAMIGATDAGADAILGLSGSPVTFYTGSTERMRIDSSGNVGIGETSPDTRLHVTGTTSDYGILAEQPSGYAGLALKSTTVNQTWSFLAQDNGSNSDLQLYGGSSAGIKMTIDSNGNVGIGTSSSTGFWGPTSSSAKTVIQYSDSGTSVGTASKGLVIQNYNSTTGNQSSLVFGTWNSVNTPVGTSSIWGIHDARTSAFSTGQLAFGTMDGAGNIQERMRIDSSGNVGIGTSSPSTNLEVSSATTNTSLSITNSSSYLNLQSNSNDGYINLAGSGNLIFRTGTPSVSERMRIDSSGNLLLGTTTTSAKLTISQPSGADREIILAGVNGVSNGLQVRYISGAMQYILTGLGTGTVSSSAGVLSASSDQNMKIADGCVDNALDKISALTPRYFYWKDENGNSDIDKGRQLGFFAQEVNKVVPEAAPEPKDDQNGWGVLDRSLVATLVKAIQEQQAMIEELKAEVAALKGA